MSARFAWIGRILRGRRLDRSPLRRGSDRVETVVLAALLAVFLGAAPFAAHAAATWISVSGQQQLMSQQANFRQVTAVLLEPAWTLEGYGAAYTAQADARWVALNKRRLAAWEAEWLTTGPRWTSHAGPPAGT